jgi:hypothetical protein
MKGSEMKKLLALILAVGVTATVASAQEVLSQNAVGYVKVTAEEGNLYLLRNDFESVDGSPMSIENVLGEQVPAGTTVILFDESAQSYLPGIGRSQFGWAAAATNVLERGRAFFMSMPPSAPEPSYEVFIMGEVPDADTPLNLGPGLNMTGLPFPAVQAWLDTDMAAEAPAGATLVLWDTANQTYLPGIGKSQFGWAAAATGLEVEPGQAFFLILPPSASPVAFDEVKPYTWP